MAEQLKAPFQFGIDLVLTESSRQFCAIGDARQIEKAAAQRPVTRVPFRRQTIAVAPGVGGIVEGTGIDDRPIEKIIRRIVRIGIGVENIDGAEFADGDDKIVMRPAAAQLIGGSRDVFLVTTKIDGLPKEKPMQTELGF